MLCLLHVWMALARLRVDMMRPGGQGALLSDALFGIFWADAERRLVALGVTNPLILSKNVNVYTRFYYGSCISYDMALENGSDAALADALWRNLLACDPDASPEVCLCFDSIFVLFCFCFFEK